MYTKFQKSDKLDSTKDRPISVTQSLGKVFERLFLTQMIEFIVKHKIINRKQFKFHNKKSATDAALELVETVSSKLDQSKETVAIFLELAKAFIPFCITFSFKRFKSMAFPKTLKNTLFISCQPLTKCKT